MEQTYPQQVRELMRFTIKDCGGNEVFFLGHTDPDQRVIEVEVLARGSREAVPAILQGCRFGDVVIHNHPSGRLEPSAADIEIASRLGAMGVGFHIVDNDLKRLYKVVESFRPQQLQALDPAQIAAILGPNGRIEQTLPEYENRPEQLRMSFAVVEAFNHNRLSLIEAGTGTGKSLAYLVPALLWAVNNGERVVVSTNTINLQEQLIRKDLPFLERASGIEFKAVLVKGRSNYLCRRRLQTAGQEPGLFDSDIAQEIETLRDWAETTQVGSREELNFLPRAEAWDEVCCEADQCARVRCKQYQACFFHRARRQAAQADLLVVNHALLLSDLAVRAETDNYSTAAVLPPYDRIIIDEAHHLEDVATQFFATNVTRFAFARALNRLRHPRKPERGLLPQLLSLLARELPDSEDALYRDIHARIDELSSLRLELFDRAVADLEGIGLKLAGELREEISDQLDIRHRVLPEFRQRDYWAGVRTTLNGMATETLALASGLEALDKQCELIPEAIQDKLASQLTDLAGIGNRLQSLAAELHQFIARDDDHCVWFEVKKSRLGRSRALITRLCTAPIEIAEALNQALFAKFRTVVMTSATLSVDQRFHYFKQRVGLTLAEPARVAELILASPFDFSRQARLLIPTDAPEPGQAGYPEMVVRLVEQGVLAADGRSFVLFTAYSLLRRVYEELAPVLQARGYHCLRQGESARHTLLREFIDDPTSILFATDSFWEGVDVPGDALQQVIIARLPFKVPTEPVLEARAEAITRTGGNPFADYTIPQAVLKFKQGFGRLIRHRNDLGVVLILDSRVIRKGYGKRFLRSLPEVPKLTVAGDQIATEIRLFLRPPAQTAAR
jgi:ATP-dependent DNA helicase DinG